MRARFTLMLGVVMAAGLGGCFDSQTDETFEDTVVLDDVDVRVLHAAADAPEITLDVDGEARTDGIDFGEVATFALPANQYGFRVRGDAGADSLQVLLSGEQDNLEEGKRYDLIVTGRLADDSKDLLIFGEPDETFDGETQDERDEANQEAEENDEATDDGPLEQVRLRFAHATPGAGAMDLYLQSGTGSQLDGDSEADATLQYGERTSEFLREAGVYRVRLTQAGDASAVLYDSGPRLDLEFDQDLLVSAIPSTGLDNAGRSFNLSIQDGEQSSLLPPQDQLGGLEFVHANGGEGAVEVFLNDNSTWDGVSFGTSQPDSGSLGYRLDTQGDYSIDIEDSGDAVVATDNVRLDRGRGTTAVFVEDANDDSASEVAVLVNDERKVVTNARVRLLHAANGFKNAVDIYLVESGQSLSQDGTVQTPLAAGVDYLDRSALIALPESTNHELVVTPADTPGTILLRSPVSLQNGGNYRLIVAGDGNSDAVQLVTLGGVR